MDAGAEFEGLPGFTSYSKRLRQLALDRMFVKNRGARFTGDGGVGGGELCLVGLLDLSTSFCGSFFSLCSCSPLGLA